MRPSKLESNFESARETCNKMDGNLVEIHTELELEAAMEVLEMHISPRHYKAAVFTGAVKNTTEGATENSYFWNISRSDVNFTLLKIAENDKPCLEKECTLILTEGTVTRRSYKESFRATALCKLPNQRNDHLKEETKARELLERQSMNLTKNIESSASKISVLNKNKTTLFVLYSLNLIALLGLGIFTFIIWKKLN